MKQLRNAYTVSQVNGYISNMFAQDFALSGITIKGEISNLKYHTSGHIYFTLKDSASQISGVMFARDRAGLQFKLEDGMSVLCTGNVGVYERGGNYQIYARSFVADGIGDLYVRFEQLKEELSDMGLFDPMYKKPIPDYASRIGIVTAKTGAAVRDIIQISKRRNPYVDITLYPALVQGDGAVESIVRGIKTLDLMNLDVIIVGRGGGSIEDLWAFNERDVAQAIFDADTPIISAVGHETDTTIADFVADLRAPTPSAGAELAVFDFQKFIEDLAGYKMTLNSVINEHIHDARQKTSLCKLNVNQHNPKFILSGYQKKSILLKSELDRHMQDKLVLSKDKLKNYLVISTIMNDRLQTFKHRFRDFDGFSALMEKSLDKAHHKLMLRTERLDAVSPLRKLSGGYGYVQGEDGHRLDSIKKVKEGSIITTTLKDGRFRSRVEEVIYAGKS
ncbi:exodeoxyribonuclease VII large subunit [Oribacterium sp. WCC10]|uniref:exodeoxyribonuclease VII large subunit n=1 Tax=Oribacterium sp. WCC10 TaxID=1855343 RepID=UPI0008E223C1|nr:exodeoxyribonuclease VII large subunit [Oribacterium sp. WCC10]SFG21216.1 Exodeoxyribonuclease VII large subunit [Oribacterium sp. WCC10]